MEQYKNNSKTANLGVYNVTIKGVLSKLLQSSGHMIPINHNEHWTDKFTHVALKIYTKLASSLLALKEYWCYNI